MRGVRFYCTSREIRSREATLVEELGQSGVPVVLSDGPSHLPAVVVFERLDQSLLEFVRTASRDGLGRVLAVAASREGLASGDAFRLLGAGASEVIVDGPGSRTVQQIAAQLARWEEIDAVIESPLVESNLVGRSRAWLVALRQLIEVAKFTDAPSLILGESGTGKELAARLLHTLDGRANTGELVVIDCTTVVPELSGSEFFGHERGAYTGAANVRDGAFALADGGTLFLDEIGELPLTLQAQLLRVVQERTYKRVGSNTWHKTNFRLVCATNRDLSREVELGTFRRDLYYRIASTVTRLPPLRERVEDIVPLTNHFIQTLRPGLPVPELDDEVRGHLLRRQYPGNVRELRQLVSRALLRHVPPGPLTVGTLPEEERPLDVAADCWRNAQFDDAIRRAVTLGARLKDIGRCAEDAAVRIAVENEAGNLQRAAARLGVTDRALQLRRASQRQPD